MDLSQKKNRAGIKRSYLRLHWIIFSGVLALVLLAGGNALLDFNHERDLLRQDLETAETMQTMAIAQAILEPVSAGDWAAVQAEFYRLESVLGGNSLRLEDPRGAMLANSQKSRANGPITPGEMNFAQTIEPHIEWTARRGRLQITKPITNSQGQVIAIIINETDEQAKITQLFQSNLQRTARFFLLIALVLVPTLVIIWKINRELEETVVERTQALEASSAAVREQANKVEAMNALIAAHNSAMRELVTQSERLNRTFSLNEVIAMIGEGAVCLGKVERLAVFLLKANFEMECAWSRGLSEDFIKSALQLSRETHIKAKMAVWVGREPVLVPDVQKDQEHNTLRGLAQSGNFRAFSSWPLTYEDRPSAFVFCYYDQPKAWEQTEREILGTFFRQAAAALENARLFEAECAQRKLAEALVAVTATLTSTLELDEVFAGILNNLGQVVAHDAAIIMLIENDFIRPVRWHGMPDSFSEACKNWRFSIHELHNREAMRNTVQSMVIPDTSRDPQWVRTVGMEWIQSYAGAPICQRGEVTGFIDVMSAQPNYYTAEIGPILQAFANQAAIALENARLYQNTQQRMAETSALYRAVQPLFSPADNLDALARQITESVTKEFSSAHCSLLLVNEGQTQLQLVAQSGQRHSSAPELPLDGPGLTVAAARSGSLIYSPDVNEDPNYVPGAIASRSELAIPMYASGQVFGVLNLESPEVDAFDQRSQRMLMSFAEQAALGLENAKLFATIRQNAAQMTKLHEVAERRAQEAETMRQVITALSSTLDLQTVLDRILNQLEQVVPHDNATMFLVEDAQRMRVWAVKKLTHIQYEYYYPRDTPLFREIERSKSPLALPDAQKDPRFCPWKGTDNIRSWMGVPLVTGNDLVGILTLDRYECNVFRAEEIELARVFANQAAIAVQNARLYESAQQRARELEALHVATTSLVTTLDLEKLLERILVSAARAIPTARAAALHLLDGTGQMHLRVQHGLDENEVWSAEWSADNGLRSWVLQQRQPALISGSQIITGTAPADGLPAGETPGGYQEDARERATGVAKRSELIAPLLKDDQPLGLITLASPEPDAFVENDLHLLISFASTATAAIHNAQLHSAVQRLAITDPLTGIYNRRGFYSLAQQLLEQADLYHRPLSAIMIDVDYFKQINDRYGHDAGDVVLQALARRCRSVLRDSDLICRYGGEEFAILLAESDLAGAQGVAWRIFKSITETGMETAAGPVRVTISVGVAAYDDGCDSLDYLLKRADQALYLAKERGRNQVQLWNEGLR